MNKKLFILFLILNFSILAEWVEVKNESKDNMNSIMLHDTDTKTTSLIVTSTNFDGNMSLVYVATLAIKDVKEVEVEEGYSYGYSEISNNYLAIKMIPNGFIYLENIDKNLLLKAIKDLDNYLKKNKIK